MKTRTKTGGQQSENINTKGRAASTPTIDTAYQTRHHANLQTIGSTNVSPITSF